MASTSPTTSDAAHHDHTLDTSDAPNKSIKHIQVIKEQYDTNCDGKLDADEVQQMRADFKEKKGPAYQIILHRYLDGRHGELKEHHIHRINDDLHTTDMALRYAAYVGMATRVMRYLAYTSDFGEAFRPVAHPLFF